MGVLLDCDAARLPVRGLYSKVTICNAEDCPLGHARSRKEMQQNEKPRKGNAEWALCLCHHETVKRSFPREARIVLSFKNLFSSSAFWEAEVKSCCFANKIVIFANRVED